MERDDKDPPPPGGNEDDTQKKVKEIIHTLVLTAACSIYTVLSFHVNNSNIIIDMD